MKYGIFFLLTAFFVTACSDNSNGLNVSLDSSGWDGKKVPVGQQCARFGGKGSTPVLQLSQVPAGTNAIIMEYSDRSYQPMDDGGHGKVGYRIEPNQLSVTIPSIAGHTFDLPEKFFLFEAHRSPGWAKEGAYLPPCSGGKGNKYYVTIKAVKEVNGDIHEVLGVVKVQLGKY